jgi:hypothetical protein
MIEAISCAPPALRGRAALDVPVSVVAAPTPVLCGWPPFTAIELTTRTQGPGRKPGASLYTRKRFSLSLSLSLSLSRSISLSLSLSLLVRVGGGLLPALPAPPPRRAPRRPLPGPQRPSTASASSCRGRRRRSRRPVVAAGTLGGGNEEVPISRSFWRSVRCAAAEWILEGRIRRNGSEDQQTEGRLSCHHLCAGQSRARRRDDTRAALNILGVPSAGDAPRNARRASQRASRLAPRAAGESFHPLVRAGGN